MTEITSPATDVADVALRTKRNGRQSEPLNIPEEALISGRIKVLPEFHEAAEIALASIGLSGVKVASDKEKGERIRPVYTVYLTNVQDLLPEFEDGEEVFDTWAASYHACNAVIKGLKAKGYRTVGNYKTAVWTAVVDGKIIAIKGVPPKSEVLRSQNTPEIE